MAERYRLLRTAGRLELHDTQDPRTKPVSVDFTAGKAHHRLQFGGGKGQDIAKAVGLHKLKQPSVLDCTAGLGQEGFVLASLGCTVTLLERSPIIHALLADGLYRASLSADEQLQTVLARITLHAVDAHDWLQHIPATQQPDTIYLDPMFPERQKSALVQKEMRFLHAVVGDDQDDTDLLALARQQARHRVVVKRPRLAPLLADCQPAFAITGKAVRYDVYLPG
ncbi:MAG: class I SAM-dependent methyltransferase [Thiolinea sp.]